MREAQLWSGPAADVAATALVELAAVGTEVGLALGAGAEELHVVLTRAGAAQDEVAQARACAGTGPVLLADDGRVPPLAAPVMAADQLVELAARERAARHAEQHSRAAFAAADAAVSAAAVRTRRCRGSAPGAGGTRPWPTRRRPPRSHPPSRPVRRDPGPRRGGTG